MKKRIFIIDDNIRSLDRAVAALETKYSVDKCQSNIKAKRLLSSWQYDLLIIDVMMPTMGLSQKNEFESGYNLYKEFAKEHQIGVPVIFWTNASQDSYNEFVNKNPDIKNTEYLAKSDDDCNLLKAVDQILS